MVRVVYPPYTFSGPTSKKNTFFMCVFAYSSNNRFFNMATRDGLIKSRHGDDSYARIISGRSKDKRHKSKKSYSGTIFSTLNLDNSFKMTCWPPPPKKSNYLYSFTLYWIPHFILWGRILKVKLYVRYSNVNLQINSYICIVFFPFTVYVKGLI